MAKKWKLINGGEPHILTDEDRQKAHEAKKRNTPMRRSFKEATDRALNRPISVNGEEMTIGDAIPIILSEKAADTNLDVRTLLELAKYLRDTVGEKPVEQVQTEQKVTFDNSFIEALESKAAEAWSDEE